MSAIAYSSAVYKRRYRNLMVYLKTGRYIGPPPAWGWKYINSAEKEALRRQKSRRNNR